MQVISSPQTSSREVAVAVAGVGELAPPTRRFFHQQVLAASSHMHVVLVLVCAMLKEAFGHALPVLLCCGGTSYQKFLSPAGACSVPTHAFSCWCWFVQC